MDAEKLDIRHITCSSGRGERNVLSEGPSSYWQSNGSSPSTTSPHWIQITIPDGYDWTEIALHTYDYDSYSPSRCRVKVDSVIIKDGIELGKSNQWVVLATNEDAESASVPANGRTVRIEITANHQGGCDCKVGAIRVEGVAEGSCLSSVDMSTSSVGDVKVHYLCVHCVLILFVYCVCTMSLYCMYTGVYSVCILCVYTVCILCLVCK